VLLAATIICWLVATFLNSLTFSSSLPRHWNIATCDVGQGDALVLKSQEKVAVIDVGRTPEPLRKCLQQLGITHIDLLVLTHFDKDHVGGLDAVIGKVDSAIVGRSENSEDQELLTELRRSGAQLYRGVQGLTGSLGEAQWQVLWPDTHHPSMELGNPGSVTLIFAFPTFKALFLGDLGRDAQLALMDTVDLPSVQVVKVAHHGSADQNSTLYQKVQPIISIFSVGADNDYGHPRSETLTMLTDMGSLTPRTDQDGLILISTSSSGLSLWTER
jgi:competence protein ComEC